MIKLISEHYQGKVNVRGEVNNNLIVSNSKPTAVNALIEYAKILLAVEGINLWEVDFEMEHEFTDKKDES